jgi:hypothetical protein
LTKLTLGQRLYEVFDIKMCASYFDGTDFHTADLPWTMHGISRVTPTGIFSTEWKDLYILDDDGEIVDKEHHEQPSLFIEGKTLRMQRPYTLYLRFPVRHFCIPPKQGTAHFSNGLASMSCVVGLMWIVKSSAFTATWVAV